MFDEARIEVRAGGRVFQAPAGSPGSYLCGPVEVEIASLERVLRWSIACAGREPVDVDAVSLVWNAGRGGERVRIFRNGLQSWSRAGAAILGETQDPSRAENSIDLVRGMHHADPAVAADGQVRSEMMTVIDRGTGASLLSAGFESATGHYGTFRMGRAGGDVEVRAEAYLGGARLLPGTKRDLHSVMVSEGDSAPALLEDWAARAGKANGALTGAPYQAGWCSWYHYFHGVTEADILKNLSLADAWPFEVFQIDDGYQAHIGDWLATNEKFPSGIAPLATAIERAGRRPGIWIAPFLASPDSSLATDHPEMLAGTTGAGAPLVGMFNPSWGGLTYALDTTRPETLDYLQLLARDLVAMGFTYLKLDFTYAPSLPGNYADPTLSPAQRVRAGLEAIRRGAGPDAFLLGCGCPLGPAIGIVDGMRIGPDVAPYWDPAPESFIPPGYEQEVPATVNAWRNTLARSFMHRNLWLNDPDCLMLRREQTSMSADAVRAWAYAVAASGGMALVSDDLSLLDKQSRALLDEVIEIGRAVDDESRSGSPPRCDDLLDNDPPTRLISSRVRLTGEAFRGGCAGALW